MNTDTEVSILLSPADKCPRSSDGHMWGFQVLILKATRKNNLRKIG